MGNHYMYFLPTQRYINSICSMQQFENFIFIGLVRLKVQLGKETLF